MRKRNFYYGVLAVVAVGCCAVGYANRRWIYGKLSPTINRLRFKLFTDDESLYE